MVLDKINLPSDLKKLSEDDLIRLSVEIRDFLIKNISITGGHLASNLGVVELTLALHKVFDMPNDKIIWDVGHQSYVHKMITGRKDEFKTLRQYGGMSGFPKRSESEFDSFDTGHSSTSISAAIGMAIARDQIGESSNIIAVIGDGAMTGGMAFEALNHAGHKKLDITIIINDNDMSISENVGGLSSYLRKLRMAPAYTNIKGGTKNVLSSIPVVGKGITHSVHKFKTGVKVMLTNGMLFDELGYQYYGAVDGHNIRELVETLESSKKVKGPKIIHIITKKGKGYMPAEKNPNLFHGISQFDIKTGEVLSKKPASFSKVFGEYLVELAGINKKIVAITAAMIEGTGLKPFKESFPDRLIDVGIAEQHAVTMAAGLAVGGMKPVVAIYSTFLQRAYDQIIHDVCIQNLNVVFAIDRAGLVGADGETHHGLFDISYLSTIPNMTVLCPKDSLELKAMMKYAINEHNAPIAIRYPRGAADNEYLAKQITKFKESNKSINMPEIIVNGKYGSIISVGNMIIPALKVREKLLSKGYDYAVVNARCISPITEDKWSDVFSKVSTDRIITLEDGVVTGGFGSNLSYNLCKWGRVSNIICYGIPDIFVTHGSVDKLRESINIDENSIYKDILTKFHSG